MHITEYSRLRSRHAPYSFLKAPGGFWVTLLLLAVLFMGAACGGAGGEGNAALEGAGTARQNDGLTPEQLENGIGSIEEVELGPIDAALAQQGETIFTSKCAACHKMDARYVGPALGGVLDRRTPAYIMNMMLNPDEMVKQHPEAKKMLAEYMTIMPNQNLTEADARALLEYLRQAEVESAAEGGAAEEKEAS